MKNILKVILFLFALILTTTFAKEIFSYMPVNYNRCIFNDIDESYSCITRYEILLKKHKCIQLIESLEKYDRPVFMQFSHPSLYLNYSTDFLELYHSDKLQGQRNLDISKIIKSISKRIAEENKNMNLMEKTRLMINELYQIRLYIPNTTTKLPVFKERNISGDDLYCKVQLSGEYVYPVIFGYETPTKTRWFLVLKRRSKNYSLDVRASVNVKVPFNNEILVYGVSGHDFWEINLFIDSEYDKDHEDKLFFD